MTTQCLYSAWKEPMEAHDKLVLMWIADGHDFNQPCLITPERMIRIAEFSDQSLRQTWESIKRLERLGHLKWVEGEENTVMVPSEK